MTAVHDGPLAADALPAAPPRSLTRAAAVVIPFVLTLTTLVALALRLPSTGGHAVPALQPSPRAREALPPPMPRPSARYVDTGNFGDLLVPPRLPLQSPGYGSPEFSAEGDARGDHSATGARVVINADVGTVLAIYDEHLSAHGLRRWMSGPTPGVELWVAREQQRTSRLLIRATPSGATTEVIIEFARGTVHRAELRDVLLALDLYEVAGDAPQRIDPPKSRDPVISLTVRTPMDVSAAVDAISHAIPVGVHYLALGQPCRGDTTATAFWLEYQQDILLSVAITREAEVTTAVLTAQPRPDVVPLFCQ
jgi:hypothetical protein